MKHKLYYVYMYAFYDLNLCLVSCIGICLFYNNASLKKKRKLKKTHTKKKNAGRSNIFKFRINSNKIIFSNSTCCCRTFDILHLFYREIMGILVYRGFPWQIWQCKMVKGTQDKVKSFFLHYPVKNLQILFHMCVMKLT